MEYRNIAIIAHVNHGKTSLTDAMLKQAGMIKPEITMNWNALEQERGITIYSKNASLFYKGCKINLVDTPGHADFGSEVERVLRAIDSVILLVDANEGPMPQTKFVLKKSLELGLKPIVIVNKIDKQNARPKEVVDMTLELFMDLGANEQQLNFPVLYAIARDGIAKRTPEDASANLNPLFDLILEKIPPSQSNTELPLRMQPFNLAYDNFLGRMAICRVYEGTIRPGQNVMVKKKNGEIMNGKITKVFTFQGIERVEVEEAQAGDIVMTAGIPEIYIGDTICLNAAQEPMHAIDVDEPTIVMNFMVNNSPFAGREGKYVTSRQIKERLEKELEVNVGLKIDFSPGDYYKVFGRGELHLSILIENMRREDYELQVSQPEVIYKTINGAKNEPVEEVSIDTPEIYTGVIIEKLGKRKGIMLHMETRDKITRMVFEVPSRGLFGYKGEFVLDTRGEGILCSRFKEYQPYKGEIERRSLGSMVSGFAGPTAAYALNNLQNRGVLYIGPTVEVYEGMVIGNVSKGDELVVNPVKGKHLTNIRAAGSDTNVQLTPPFELNVERAMETMSEDEYIEITPQSIRLRKKNLTEIGRRRASRQN
ncbi:MAG: translational GTPase TypA [Parcubacteria group bacterium]|nr:translational GTPase TypA [Parcubacteria group bacterium]